MNETRKIGLEDAFKLAVRHRRAGRPAQAERIYREILRLQPNNAAVHNNLGKAFQDQGMPGEAITCYRRAMAIKPDYVKAHHNLGNVLQHVGRLDEAVTLFQRAIDIDPEQPEPYNILGNILTKLGKQQQAVLCYQSALTINPEYVEAQINLAVAYGRLGELDEAIASYQRALEISPSDPQAHWNYAQALLLKGQFEKGWLEYEWRWKCEDFPSLKRNFAQPLWDGSNLNGRTILLHCEQGMGDSIQFIRYVPIVARLGGRVVVECPPQLKGLFQSVSGIDRLVGHHGELPTFDVQAPLLSLPHIFHTTAATIPGDVPYLAAPPEAGPGLPDCPEGTRLKVGISWAGSRTNADDRNRSCRLRQFEPLWSIPGVAFFSLQYDEAAAELAGSAGAVRDLSGRLGDFAVTATIVERLDLVISVDTAVVHLAGALGKPVWVVLSFAPDWRWMLDREDTPWYPTMRLFRQPALGDWASVFARVAGELGREAAGRG